MMIKVWPPNATVRVMFGLGAELMGWVVMSQSVKRLSFSLRQGAQRSNLIGQWSSDPNKGHPSNGPKWSYRGAKDRHWHWPCVNLIVRARTIYQAVNSFKGFKQHTRRKGSPMIYEKIYAYFLLVLGLNGCI